MAWGMWLGGVLTYGIEVPSSAYYKYFGKRVLMHAIT